MRKVLRAPHALLAAAAILAFSTSAAAEPFVVLQDDGTIENSPLQTLGDLKDIRDKLLALYDATGAERPEVISVWSNFSIGGNYVQTIVDPLGNDVDGIGIAKKTSIVAPVNAILWHNDFTKLQQRANVQHAPVEGLHTYLFLLELSHLWGPALKVPAPNTNALIGFTYHWSFFLSPPSPAGGNIWTDNMDGSYTVVPQLPGDVKFTPLDLYVMGLCPPADVPPFQVLENTVVPPTPTDPLWGGAFSAKSFPWFDQDQTLTIMATPRPITIDDVIAANGTRLPAAGEKTSWTLGIVLLVSSTDDPATIEADAAAFSPLANSFAPSFATATSDKGSLVLTTDNINQGGTGGSGGGTGTGTGTGGATGGAGGTGGDGGSGTTSETGADCGCEAAGSSTSGGWAWLAALGLVAAAARRKRERAAG